MDPLDDSPALCYRTGWPMVLTYTMQVIMSADLDKIRMGAVQAGAPRHEIDLIDAAIAFRSQAFRYARLADLDEHREDILTNMLREVGYGDRRMVDVPLEVPDA